MVSFFTVSISSGLLAATNNVKVANASLLMVGIFAALYSKLFLSKKSRKQAAAIRLLPSTKARFYLFRPIAHDRSHQAIQALLRTAPANPTARQLAVLQ